MNTKHTPGPWLVRADGVEAGDPAGFAPFAGCGCCGSPWMNGDGKETQKADAMLIAAAPELLAALRLMYEAHKDEAGVYVKADGAPKLRVDGTPSPKDVALVAARAALEAATGEQREL